MPLSTSFALKLGFGPIGTSGTPDEMGTVGALLMGQEGGFITGRDRRLGSLAAK
jgi:adenylosuccinate synthase